MITKKTVLQEIAWLSLSALISCVLIIVFKNTYTDYFNNGISLHDTYFVLPQSIPLLSFWVFVPLVFLVYLCKGFLNRFNKVFQLGIVILASLSLLLYHNKVFASLMGVILTYTKPKENNGWTVDFDTNNSTPVQEYNPLADSIEFYNTALNVVAAICLATFSIILGYRLKNKVQ